MNPHKSSQRLRPLGWRMALGASVLALAGCAAAPGWQWDARTPDTPAPLADVTLTTINADVIEQLRPKPANLAVELKDVIYDGITAPAYRISPSDVLNIVVWGRPEMILPQVAANLTPDSAYVPPGYTVDGEGYIQYPLLGLVKMAGLTEAQASEKIRLALSKHIVDPQITLRVQAYRGQKVFIEGEVRSPSALVINDQPMTVAEALGRSGGITALGDSSAVVLLRQDKRWVLNLNAMQEVGLPATRLLLRQGDWLRVTPRDETKVSVLGEVIRPSMVPTRNGRLSLNEALAEAGGLTPISASPRQIYVVRRDGNGIRAFHLDAQSPAMLALADRFELQARDIVYVDAAPLALWNRTVALLIPTLGAIQTTNNLLNNR